MHHSDTAVDSHGALSATADCSSTDLLDLQSTTEHYDKHGTHLIDGLMRFNIACQDTRKSMGVLDLGLTVRSPETEELWQKVISNNQPSDTSL